MKLVRCRFSGQFSAKYQKNISPIIGKVRSYAKKTEWIIGDKSIKKGAVSLKAMQAKINTDKMKAPSFLMVLTETGDFASRRPDGVLVVPIGCLKH